MDIPPERKKEEKRQESEAPWESPWYECEEDIDSKRAVDAMMEDCLQLEQIGEEELAIIWSGLEPRYENVWHVEGNTVRCIKLRVFHYAEHMELGLSEVGQDQEESLRRIFRRTCMAVEHLLPMGKGDQYKKMREFIASQGGQEAWKKRFQEAIKGIIAGDEPAGVAVILPELDITESGEKRIELLYPAGALLVVQNNTVSLELPGIYEPSEVHLGLAGGGLAAIRSEVAENRWVFQSDSGFDVQEIVFRPLVLSFRQSAGQVPAYHHTWPSVGNLELFESLSKAPAFQV